MPNGRELNHSHIIGLERSCGYYDPHSVNTSYYRDRHVSLPRYGIVPTPYERSRDFYSPVKSKPNFILFHDSQGISSLQS